LDNSASEQLSTGAGTPSPLDIFLAFSGIAIVGFGGVLPWARRMLVEQRRWLTADEFTEILSLGQFLPGGNIVNVSIVVGQRFRGPLGSLAAVLGLLAAPVAIVIALGGLYLRYGQHPAVHGALHGVTAAAAGLILSMAAKMAAPLFRREKVVSLAIAAATFVAVGLLGLSLPWALLVLVPISIALAWRFDR
jgi:chromate transporter